MAWFNLGDTLAKKGRHDEAIASFRRALELRPNDAPGHNDLACELVVIGQPLAAIPLFERALVLRPGYAEVHNNLGNAFRSLGRIAEATAQYEKALAAKPDYPEAHNNLACELSAQGVRSSLHRQNERLIPAITVTDRDTSPERYPLLFDPQTSGGLLLALPAAEAPACVAALCAAGYAAAAIGELFAT